MNVPPHHKERHRTDRELNSEFYPSTCRQLDRVREEKGTVRNRPVGVDGVCACAVPRRVLTRDPRLDTQVPRAADQACNAVRRCIV